MIKILFICHGNICRSPMAEFIMRQLAEEAGLGNELEIRSAATSREDLGNAVYPPVRELLARQGIDCRGKRAQQISALDISRYDYLIVMDDLNLRELSKLYPQLPRQRITKLLEFTGSHADIADPWYTRDFERCQLEISRGCAALLEQLRHALQTP